MKDWRMDQVVERLPNKPKTLSSNPSTEQNKKKKKRITERLKMSLGKPEAIRIGGCTVTNVHGQEAEGLPHLWTL
jgi:hypothetical protein